MSNQRKLSTRAIAIFLFAVFFYIGNFQNLAHGAEDQWKKMSNDDLISIKPGLESKDKLDNFYLKNGDKQKSGKWKLSSPLIIKPGLDGLNFKNHEKNFSGEWILSPNLITTNPNLRYLDNENVVKPVIREWQLSPSLITTKPVFDFPNLSPKTSWSKISQNKTQFQTIIGETADSVVISALSSSDKPEIIPLSSLQIRSGQKECDNALKSSNKVFIDWKSELLSKSNSRTNARRYSKMAFDHAEIWLRDFPELNTTGSHVRRAVQDAMNNCFTKIRPTELPKNFALRVGAIIFPSGKRECTGLQIAVDRVLTARHCLQLDNGRNGLRDASDKEIANFRFEMQDGTAYAVLGIHARGVSTLLPDEWLVFKTAPMPEMSGSLPVSSSPEDVEPGAPMMVAGLIIATDEKKFSPGYSRGDSCRAVYATRACIVHTCNTVPGLSGAPLFVWQDKQWVLAGIHVRSMDDSNFNIPACKHKASAGVKTSQTNGGVYAASVLH